MFQTTHILDGRQVADIEALYENHPAQYQSEPLTTQLMTDYHNSTDSSGRDLLSHVATDTAGVFTTTATAFQSSDTNITSVWTRVISLPKTVYLQVLGLTAGLTLLFTLGILIGAHVL